MSPSVRMPPPPAAPPPPPNPPMFGSEATRAAGNRQRQASANAAGFAGTILGAAATTGQKTLLGQ